MRIWYFAVGSVLVGALAAVSMSQNQSSREEIRQLSAEVGRLAATIRETPSQQQDKPPQIIREVRVEVPVLAPAPPEPAPAADRPTPSPPTKSIEPAVVHSRMEEHFQAEPEDGAWAHSAERTAESGVKAALPDHSMLRSIECRASMCRIETEHADTERSYAFTKTAFMTPGKQVWNGAFLSMRTNDPADSRVVTVTYLAREGLLLPMEELLSSDEIGLP